MSKQSKNRKAVWFTEEQHELLKALADAERRSIPGELVYLAEKRCGELEKKIEKAIAVMQEKLLEIQR